MKSVAVITAGLGLALHEPRETTGITANIAEIMVITEADITWTGTVVTTATTITTETVEATLESVIPGEVLALLIDAAAHNSVVIAADLPQPQRMKQLVIEELCL